MDHAFDLDVSVNDFELFAEELPSQQQNLPPNSFSTAACLLCAETLSTFYCYGCS